MHMCMCSVTGIVTGTGNGFGIRVLQALFELCMRVLSQSHIGVLGFIFDALDEISCKQSYS